jgi:hypothetical protein
MKLGCISLIIGSVDFLIGVVMLRVVDVESVEILIGLETIRATAISSVGILIGVIAIEVIVIDWKSRDGLI